MAGNITPENLLYALLGGVLPALLWLWFWLKEDSRRPEPRGVLIATFFAGMAAVLFALVMEHSLFIGEKWLGIEKAFWGTALLLFLWALIEETLKYFAAYFAALKKKSFDEPVDALIYLITAALGFAALENTLFLLQAFGISQMSGLITTNLRFLGATLLHVATSGIVGASIGFSFFHKEDMKRNVVGGIAIATILHFIFNYYIINGSAGSVLKVFIPLWIVIIFVIFLFERVKRIKKEKL